MNCRDLDHLLASHGNGALSSEARRHAGDCPRCGNLLRVLATDEADAAGELRPALANAIASRLAIDLTAVRPLAPAAYLAAGFASIFVVLALLGALLLGPLALARMDWLTAAITFASLAVSAGLLAYALSTQMAPGSRQLAPAWMLDIGILLGLALVFVALFSYQHEAAFWLNAGKCLRVGLASGLLAGVLFWLVLRRGAVLDAPASGALAGLLGGLAGTTILEIHCPDFNVAHILIGHWVPALACASVGWIAGAIVARRE